MMLLTMSSAIQPNTVRVLHPFLLISSTQFYSASRSRYLNYLYDACYSEVVHYSFLKTNPDESIEDSLFWIINL
jgi:hypothetical protein